MKKQFQLTEEEWAELLTASKRVRETPVMLVGNVDISAGATDSLNRLWAKFGEKYGFDAFEVEPIDEKQRIISARATS